MMVQVTKLQTKGSVDGMFPVGFKITGDLVDQNGMDITDPLKIPKEGLFLRTQQTAFSTLPYQFATDGVISVQMTQPGIYLVDTISAVWQLKPI